jgi:hypothetical protein
VQRFETALAATCRPILDQKSRWKGLVQDVSASGLGLLLDRRFETGVLLHVEITDEATGASFAWLVKIRWVRELAARKWSVGCMFNQELSAEDLRAVLECKRSAAIVEAVAC